jgi:hypothetical protein
MPGLTGRSALGDAICQASKHPEIAQMLLDAGADVNLQGGFYGCPLNVRDNFIVLDDVAWSTFMRSVRMLRLTLPRLLWKWAILAWWCNFLAWVPM